ncbi:MAG: aldose 1-epimerase family protein [Solirubrobacteraceae bacterium]
MSPPPSGRQFELKLGEQRATVVEVGGGVRSYAVGDRQVLDPYPMDAICDGAHGAPLIPWPNRLADGQYRFDGSDYQVELSEPARHNAIHGFMRWRPWRLCEHSPFHAIVEATLHPMPGYPFTLELQILYALGRGGLTVSTTATNLGTHACLYGAGQHPYLSPGSGSIDECTLQLPAATRLVNDEQLIPTGSASVAGTPADFRAPRPIGDTQLDMAFTDLERDETGRAVTRLTGPDGRCVELWVDESYTHLEVFTGDTLADTRRRRGLAVEPMTCAPNAFQSGEGLVRLEPGQSLTSRWGVRLLAHGS